MGSTRLKGNALSFLVDGIDYWADATRVELGGEEIERKHIDGRVETYRERSWFDVDAVQSTDPDSFWTFLWEHPGAYLPFGYAPHGNSVATVAQPHFTGVLILPDSPPVLGGAAGRTVEQTFTTRLHIAQGPHRVTTT